MPGAAQVNVTRVTVNDRQAPPEPAPYGTQMARGPVCLNLGSSWVRAVAPHLDSILEHVREAVVVGTWQEPDPGRPIAALLERCAELPGVDLAANVEPYVRADGTRI